MHEVPCLVMNPGERACIGIRDIHPPSPGSKPGVWRTSPFFAGLVVIAGEFHPIPFRTRPLKPPAPMVLRVNTRESRSPPGLQRTDHQTILILRSVGIARVSKDRHHITTKSPVLTRGAFCLTRYSLWPGLTTAELRPYGRRSSAHVMPAIRGFLHADAVPFPPSVMHGGHVRRCW